LRGGWGVAVGRAARDAATEIGMPLFEADLGSMVKSGTDIARAAATGISKTPGAGCLMRQSVCLVQQPKCGAVNTQRGQKTRKTLNLPHFCPSSLIHCQ